MAANNQYFDLTLDTTAPSGQSIVANSYYNSLGTVSIDKTADTAFMKIWADQTATPAVSAIPASVQWVAAGTAVTTWTLTAYDAQAGHGVKEGVNYVHALFMDNVGNQATDLVHSNSFIYDVTAPTITEVSIADGAAMTPTVSVKVKVTANDGTGDVSQVKSMKLSGDIVLSGEAIETEEILWDATDLARGYKEYTVTLKALTSETASESRTVSAKVFDNAGNASSLVSDTILLYTGEITFAITLRDPSAHGTKKMSGEYTNVNAWDICLDFNPDEYLMVTGYKVWGDINTDGGEGTTSKPDTWTDWSGEATATCIDVHDFKLSSGTANKKINAELRVLGKADPVTTNEFNINFSTQAPSVTMDTIERNVGQGDTFIFSEHSPYDAKTVTGSMVPAFTGTAAAEIKVVAYASDSAATSGTAADAAIAGMSTVDDATKSAAFSKSLTKANLVAAIAGDGSKYLVMYAKDLCGNWGKSATQFVKVDTAGPVVTWGTVAEYYKEASGFDVTATDDPAEVSKMKVWVDTNATTSAAPSSAVEYDTDGTTGPTAAQVYWDQVQQGTNYAHIIYTDSVGNTTLSHSVAFVYDSVAPTGTIAFSTAYTNQVNQNLTLTWQDATSGTVAPDDMMIKVYGDINNGVTEEAATWEKVNNETLVKSITLKGNATASSVELKTVHAKYKDPAGNVSTECTATITLDTEISAPSLQLLDADGNELATHVKVTPFQAKIASTVAAETQEITEYLLYGTTGDDFYLDSATKTPITKANAEWKTYTYSAEDGGMIVSGLNFTETEGEKKIKVEIKDRAGNISELTNPVVAIYDVTAPEVDVADVDYDVISKQSAERRDATGTIIVGTRCDKMTFSFSCGEAIQAWKVCVNTAGQTAAGATAIPMAANPASVNMSGGNNPANQAVNCVIMGTDFGNVPAVATGGDGEYEVIVYVQDLAGNWSAVHDIS